MARYVRAISINSTTRFKKRMVAIAGFSLTLAAFIYLQNPANAQMQGHGMRHHGQDGKGHDMTRMPGLRGEDATKEESIELANMFRNFRHITREVTNLPNGIKTITHAEHEGLMAVIVSHVTGMITRVEEGRDPKIFIQSPTLDIIFERRDAIKTEIETTDKGIVVIQTSDDPEVVEALQIHAEEVTAMVDRGMHAVHEMMMERQKTR